MAGSREAKTIHQKMERLDKETIATFQLVTGASEDL
jgi:hypothetical protein